MTSPGSTLPVDPVNLLEGHYDAERYPDQISPTDPVPRVESNILNDADLIRRPILDEMYLAHGNEQPTWPGGHEYAVCLTHDVDDVAAKSFRHELRRGYLRARERFESKNRTTDVFDTGLRSAIEGLGGGILRGGGALTHRGRDPTHRFEEWLAIEEQYDAQSTFFFSPHSARNSHITDPVYRYDDTLQFEDKTITVTDFIQILDQRGWEVGLHPTWNSYADADEMCYQKKQLTDVVGEVKSVRQHWLHTDIRVTPRLQAQAGFAYDCSLGVKGDVGFRFGTSYPWNVYDVGTDQYLDLLEIPPTVQDAHLFGESALDLDREDAVDLTLSLAKRVKSVGGVLTLNWHPDRALPGHWWQSYVDILERLSEEHDPWFASAREIGKWWSEHGISTTRRRAVLAQ